MISKRLSLFKCITASLVVVAAIISQIFNASLKPASQIYLKSPVLAFEFARNMDDIRKLFFTQGTPAHQFVADIRVSIQIDFFFIATYTAFMALLAIELRSFSKALALIALVLAIVAGVCDVLENIEMLRIASWAAGSTGSTDEPSLSGLQFFTWTKWLGCGVYMAVISSYLWNKKGLMKLLAILSIATFLLGIAAFVMLIRSGSQKFITCFVMTLFLSLGILIVGSIIKYLLGLRNRSPIHGAGNRSAI